MQQVKKLKKELLQNVSKLAISIQTHARRMSALRILETKRQQQLEKVLNAVKVEVTTSPQNARQAETLGRKSSFLCHILSESDISHIEVLRADNAAKVIQEKYREFQERHKTMHGLE